MKNQDPLSSKDKSEKLKGRLLKFLFGALMINTDDRYADHPWVAYLNFISYVQIS